VELIRRPEKLAEFNGQRLGTPILYPTPCRVPDGYFTYLGREFHFPINRDDTHIHGLVRDIPWSYDTPVVDSSEVSVTLRMEFAPGSEIYGYFPLEHTLELTYTPNHSVRVSPSYEHKALGIGMSSMLSFNSEQYSDAANIYPVDDHLVVDANIYKRLGSRGKLTLQGDNIFDSDKGDERNFREGRTFLVRLDINL